VAPFVEANPITRDAPAPTSNQPPEETR
jgi:hypothetical protein